MTFSILTNAASLNAQKNLGMTNKALAGNFNRLSSGKRINIAADDAAGLAISSNLTADIRSSVVAQRNANDGISLLQVAEGGMNEITGILTRMRELAMQSATDTVTDANGRDLIQLEFAQQINEINRISSVTEFNGTALLDGSAAALDFQVGVNNTANDRITVAIADMDATALTVSAATVATKAGAQTALGLIDTAINNVSGARANVGAFQNRLQVTVQNLANFEENTSAANARIRDVDVARETAALTRNQILTQAGTAMLAQANAAPQGALSLLGG